MRIEAIDLQAALTKASNELSCSVVDLEYDILQYPKKGFLGIGKKNAIIEARCLKKTQEKKNAEKKYKEKNSNDKHKIKQQKQSAQKPVQKDNARQKYTVKSDDIFKDFHKENHSDRNPDDLLDEIKKQIESLFSKSCFNISLQEVSFYDKNCILIKFDGEDVALMIGKEAHRYKALSYLLHNWINSKYKFLIRLEIAQFLENQSNAIESYVNSVIEKVNQEGRAQTKHLDGVLIKIALEKLRKEFPNKYVAIKEQGEKRIIIIKDFQKKDE